MSGLIADTAVGLPSPALRPFITKYAGFRISGLPSGVHYGLPSSGVHLIISLGHPIELLETPNTRQSPLTLIAFVSGLQDRPAIVRQNDKAFGLHVFIKPLGVKAILGVASPDISSLVLNLTDIWGSRAEALIELLLDATSWSQRFAIMDRAFVSKLNPAVPRPEISWSWERLAKSHGSVPVQQLADEIGYSRRHFSQHFRDEIGVSPKLAARLFRFEHACRLVADSRLGLAHVALSCGYYDQAHLTREWYALAGCSPKVWVTREFPFLQDYELGD
jgi:AraC-like DNA-binding protein